MSQTSPTAITALPAAPSTAAPSTFSSLADAFIAALATLRTETNSISTVNYNNAVDAYNNAVAGAASAAAAAASSVAATAAANVTKWVSGTTYAQGAGVWSPANYQSYRRKVAGAGTTDPSLDTANWALLGPGPAVVSINYQQFGGL